MTMRIVSVVLLMLSWAWGAAAQTTPDMAACRAPDKEKALAACKQIIDDPNTSPRDKSAAYFARGFKYADGGEHDKAVTEYDESLKLVPDANGFYNRGLSHAAKGRADRAIADLEEAVKLKPQFPEALLALGNRYHEKNQNDRAIETYDKAIKLKADYPMAYYNRGIANTRLGKIDEAIGDYDTAIKLKPDYPSPYLNRGIRYHIKGDYDRALADFDMAIKLRADYAAAYYRRGLTYFAKGDRARAILDYARAETTAVAETDSYNKGQQELAKKDLKALLDAPAPAPKNPEAPAKPLKRYALIIANAKYQSIKPLDNPERDAKGIAQALQGLGFDVTVRENLNRATLRSEFRTFEARVRKEAPDWALVYFSGHGTETAEGAFMLPVDVLMEKEGEFSSDLNIVEDSVSVQNVLKRIQSAKALRLVIYDACRDNPALSAFNRVIHQSRQAVSGGNRSTGMGWGRDVVIFATSPGTFALDGEPGEMSPFAKSLVTLMSKPGLEMKDMVRDLADEVETATKEKRVVAQRPQVYGFPLEGEHFFMPKAMAATNQK